MNKSKLLALLGAAVLTLGVAGTALAATTWATVTGHMASTSDNNDPNWWEENAPEGLDLTDCTKVDSVEGSLGDQYVLEHDYELVVVKAGSTNQGDPNTLTLFAGASAGETVWADYNPDNAYGDGDKNISHIIFCDGSDEESTPTPEVTPEVTPSFDLETLGITDAPSEPSTDSIGGAGTSSPADGAWLLVVALGMLLASIVVLTPARAKSRR